MSKNRNGIEKLAFQVRKNEIKKSGGEFLALWGRAKPHEDLCKANIAKTIIFIVFFKRARNIDTPPSIRQGFDRYSTRTLFWRPGPPGEIHYQRFLNSTTYGSHLATTYRYT